MTRRQARIAPPGPRARRRRLARWADAREPGIFAAPLTVGLVLAILRLPERWALLVGPGPAWDDAHQRWPVLLAVAALVLLACTRDPARGGRR